MHKKQIWYQKYKIRYFKIFPIALNTHFSAENAQFWVKIARKKFKLEIGESEVKMNMNLLWGVGLTITSSYLNSHIT